MNYFAFALILCIHTKAFCLVDVDWSTLVDFTVERSNKDSEVDQEMAVTAYRNIAKKGIAATASQKIKAKFGEAITLPKRFDELTPADIKKETQDLATKNKNEGGFKEFLTAQGITTTVK